MGLAARSLVRQEEARMNYRVSDKKRKRPSTFKLLIRKDEISLGIL
jgi:hypothetical protein